VLRNGIDLTHSVENEHFCMRLTAALGMPVANTSIQRFGKRTVLVVERFDRHWTKDKRLLRVPLAERIKPAVDVASDELPRGFPRHIRESIVEGLLERAALLKPNTVRT